MAIEVDDDQPSNKESAPAAQAEAAPSPRVETAQQAPQQKPTSPQGTRNMSNTNISARQNYGIPRAAQSHAVRTLIEAIDKISAGTQTLPVEFQYIAIDGEAHNLLISAIVVTAVARNATGDAKLVAHHTLLLESTARGVSSIEGKFNNVPYERLVHTCDAYDATLRGKIEEQVKALYPGYGLIDADATAVPANLDIKSEEAVRNVVSNATVAASSVLSSYIAPDGYALTAAVAAEQFQTEVKTSHGHFIDLVQQPVRGDVVLEMSRLTGRQAAQQQGGELNYNSSQAKETITHITGFIDLVSTPNAVQQQFGGNVNFVNNNAEVNKIYTPRFVITNIDAPDVAPELPVLLQGLATTVDLNNNARWVGALIQQHKNGAAHANGGVNIRDLSAIGLEAPVISQQGNFQVLEQAKQGRLSLDSVNTNDAVLAAVIQTYIHSDLLVSIDVPQCGPSAWQLTAIVASAMGDQRATNEVIDAANLLTEGRFLDLYRAACGGTVKPLFFNDNALINLGYYDSPEGPRDIRDIDYLAVLNATGDTSLADIDDWSNLLANADVDPFFRLQETRRIQQRLIEGARITGRALRITANPAFLYALATAVYECGVVYETKIGVSAPQGTARLVPAYMRNLPTGLGNAGGFAQAGARRPVGGGLNTTSSYGRFANSNLNRSNNGSGNF